MLFGHVLGPFKVGELREVSVWKDATADSHWFRRCLCRRVDCAVVLQLRQNEVCTFEYVL